jgi:hypothetical protein
VGKLVEADLVDAVRAAVGADPGDARYFDATVDLDGDGVSEKLVYLAGPMMCGTGGCPLFVFTPSDGVYRLVSRLSVVQVPVRLSPRSSRGWRNLIVHVAGGGAVAGDVELEFDGSGYPSNPTVAPARPVTDLQGTEILIPDFGSYTEGKSMTEGTASGAAVYGDPATPVAGRVYDTVIHTQNAEELRYVVLQALTDRFAAEQGITVTPAERDAYTARAREALSKDPAVAATLGEETAQDKAARAQVSEAFVLQWKLNRALYERYGGRIVYQQGGPEPIDAYRKFLEERQATGDFKIQDDAMSAQFWRHYRNDSIHEFLEPGSAEEKAAFATPPWQKG